MPADSTTPPPPPAFVPPEPTPAARAEVERTRRVVYRMLHILAGFAGASVLLGVVLVTFLWQPATAAGRFFNAVGWQFAIWGLIDLVIVAGGLIKSRRAVHRPLDAEAVTRETADRQNLLRVLHFNKKLNWMWVGLGVLVLAAGPFVTATAAVLGHGTGWLIQAGFLFAFDRAFARRV